MGETQVVGPGLTPDWLEKRNNVFRAIDDQVVQGLRRPGTGWNLDELQERIVEHRKPIVLTPEQMAAGIIKTVTIQIGGGRTTDQMIEAAKRDCGNHNVSGEINQRNMPSGYGKLRAVTLEFRQFDHDPYTEEVTDWQNQPGHGPSGYEDGLRFREFDPEVQRKNPHVFIPEAPWCVTNGVPCALNLWSFDVDREVSLFRCSPRSRWNRVCLFARRKYSVG